MFFGLSPSLLFCQWVGSGVRSPGLSVGGWGLGGSGWLKNPGLTVGRVFGTGVPADDTREPELAV